MSAISEALKLESEHSQNDEGLYVIHLFPEGKFFRAYEWSAWIVVTHINDFKVTRREIKTIERDVCYIGFPQESLEKWTPEGATVSDRPDGGRDMLIPEKFRKQFADKAAMNEEFSRWREKLPISEFKEKSSTNKDKTKAEKPEGDLTARELMLKVLAFPIETKSPLETMEFLSQIKAHIARLLTTEKD